MHYLVISYQLLVVGFVNSTALRVVVSFQLISIISLIGLIYLKTNKGTVKREQS